MSEDYCFAPSDRAVEQALVALKKGAHLLKYGRRGKPKFCPFRLSTDEKFLIWYSGEEERQLRLNSITKIIRGQKTTNFQKQLQPEKECQSFSIIYANGQHSLDLICKDKAQADSWYLGLRAVISKSHNSRAWVAPKIPRATQSCVNSPSSYIRRKQTLGLLEEPIKFSQVRRLSGSSPLSKSLRRASDDLSCSSDSFYSESNLLIKQNPTHILTPNSTYAECDTQTRFQTPIHADEEKTVLRDVLIWGEGIEGGCLGGFNKSSKHLGNEFDSLIPKQLESTTALDVHKISLGGKHAALVTKQGEVFCWGDGKGGRLGNKVNMDVTYPKMIDSVDIGKVNSVACGEYQTCAVTFSGELYTWGDNCHRDDTCTWLPHRILLTPLKGFTVSQVACGEWHMAILSTSGKLFTCGNGTFGVLGHGNLESVCSPKVVESLESFVVKSVACGPWHTGAIVEIAADCYKLYTWGDGDKGRLGHMDEEKKLLPTRVERLAENDFTQVACGVTLTAAVTVKGKVFTMGSRAHGQLGNPRAKDKSITMVYGELQNEFVTELSIGSYHLAVLTLSGSVYTWGKGLNGQLGLGDSSDRNFPTLVEALRDREVESITCGSNLTAVICLHKSVSSEDQSACKGCGLGFSFTRKKHNCYNCGVLFCHACSSKKTNDASLAPNRDKYFRVCDSCFIRLRGTSNSDRPIKLEDRSPRLYFSSRKRICDENVEGERAPISTPCKMIANNTCSNEYTNGIKRWGHVSRPMCFESPKKVNRLIDVNARKNHVSSIPSNGMNGGLLEFDNILTKEVQKLKAEVERLEKLCQIRSEKIQKYKRKTEETWSLAKVEAEKSKASKEVIQILTTKLRAMSVKISGGNDSKDQVVAHLSQVAPIDSIDTSSLNDINTLYTPQVGKKEDKEDASVCLFTNTLNSISNGDVHGLEPVLDQELDETNSDLRRNGIKTSKLEWVEKYESGVYITFTTLPSGKKGLKRVRFSRKKFTWKQAEKWWKENEQAVYGKYEMEGYISSNKDEIIQ